MWWRRKTDKPEKFIPKKPSTGDIIPPGIWRKLDWLEEAMRASDKGRVAVLQEFLAVNGYEVPTNLHEVEMARRRLKKHETEALNKR